MVNISFKEVVKVRSTYLLELVVKKPWVLSVSKTSEELRLYNLD
jgi:hypothetical protein